MVKAAYALAAAPLVAASDAFVATPAQTHQVVNTPAVASTHTAAAPQQEASSSSSSFAYGAVGVGIAGVAMARSSKKSSRVQKPQVSLCAFEEELGVQKPIGFWDPLGFTKDGDEGTFRRRRCVELKHGRVCMIASIGYIVPEYFKFEGYLSPSQGLKFADVPNGLAALSKVPGSGIAQFISFAGTLELWVFLDDPKRAPGDFENAGVLGLPLVKSTMEDGDKKKKRLSAEIANGRLAMMAIIGMFYQDGLTGSAWGDWSSYTDSPLRAFESELGVQAPVGFWDPLGFCADGDTKSFNRRRNTEIKHGRVSMWACTGYIVPEFVRWPGFCSPSQKIAFTEVPNGLAAFSKVPGAGWTQMILFAGAIERGVLVADDSRPPGDFEAGGVLGVPNGSTMPDGEARNKKLNAELANGRLAMMAIIGMFFQDGLTGSAWGDWALYSESPLRAFEQESGVQAPVGYWDPLGLAADGNLYEFNRRRETELKHGRISMFACIGYIAPEYYKFEGFLSPAYGVKFSDIPNGLGAISKIPALGIAQFFLFIGLVEVNVYGEQKDGEPGNYGAGFLGCRSVGVMSTGFEDPDVRKKKLNAELANGRLAMMAIIGMFFQDGCTGSAWGDWSLYTESPLRAFENELGVQAPVGFWDPLGLASDGDQDVFLRRRATEIKHGRICMIATMGYIVPEYYKFDGYLSPKLGLKFEDVPNGLAAINKIPGQGWAQIVVFAGLYELFLFKNTTGEPGNYGTGWPAIAIGQPITDPETRAKKLSAELANGRLAMMAIIGMFFQDGLTGSAWGDWSLYTASPLRAFEAELGVQAPVGFWDPLGLSADGDSDVFKRRRAAEIKHGRVSMLACIGYIVPEYFKWPGYVSPSLGIKFTDVPHGLAALSKIPLEGLLQIGLFAGHYEGFFWRQAAGREPGDFEGYGFLGIGKNFIFNFDSPTLDPASRTKKLSAELANGRLAMVAIIGMFYQDGLTGSAWGDWSLYTSSPLRAFESELGVQAPVGFWDPLGLASDGDQDVFLRRRATEIKHGRICMIATMGYIVPEYYKFDGYLSPKLGLKFEDVPNGLAAINKIPGQGWAQIVVFAGLYELFLFKNTTGEPGNYGTGWPAIAIGQPITDPETRAKKLSAELANGRLAMMAIIGMFFQDGLTGSAWGDWSLYTASPLRAFEAELGVQAPVGFWDPLGLSADGDSDVFKRRRAAEIKHGRVSMLACIGYIVPEYFKWPGYVSPSLGIKFTDVPHGLAALSKIPLEGLLQIGLFAGHYEGFFWRQAAGREPGDFEGYGFLGIGKNFIFNFDSPTLDPASRTKKLGAEIANGRLAMVAIIGMFYQDGLTGSAWGDWSLYTSSPLRAFESELGVQAPVGYWDPLGLAADGDVDTFKRRREVEVKHGRVCMFACMGYIAPYYFRFPGDISPSTGVKFNDIPNGLAAIGKVPFLGWAQWVIFCGLIDYGLYRSDPERDPGDYENAGIMGVPNASGPMGDAEGRKKKLNAELANGRLAMIAIMGMFFQNGWVGTSGPEMWGFSGMNAFENELGVQAPVGFWDPLGFAKDGNIAAFTRRRSVEIKHGRICMLATMGYITPELTGKFPGPLSPGTQIKFADVPNGLAALGKVPFGGWLQIIGYCGFVEYKADYDKDVREGKPGDMGWKPPLLATSDPEQRTRRLNAEIANGRLAMMAIIGMFFQDGLTGSAWGDWAAYTDSPLR